MAPARHDLPGERGARDTPPAAGLVDVDALTAAMSIAPGVYSRNRFFDLFKAPELRRARTRAALVRGIVHHLVMVHREGGAVASAVSIERRAGRLVLRYAVPSLRFERRTPLNDLELACVLHLAERASLPGLAPTHEQRDAMRAALLRLGLTAAAPPDSLDRP